MFEAKQLPHIFARAMENHDVDGISEWVHESYVQHNPYVPQGIPGVQFFMDAWNTAFSDTKITVDDVIVSGDRVVGRFTFRARHTGPFIGVPASNKDIVMTAIDIWRIEDGKFIEHWDEFNGVEFFDQIGGRPGQPS